MSENQFLQEPGAVESPFRIAKVTGVFADGLQLSFDGEAAPTQKHYKMLQTCDANVGERVLCANLSGTYLALGPIASQKLIIADRMRCNGDQLPLEFGVNTSKQVFIYHPVYGWLQLN